MNSVQNGSNQVNDSTEKMAADCFSCLIEKKSCNPCKSFSNGIPYFNPVIVDGQIYSIDNIRINLIIKSAAFKANDKHVNSFADWLINHNAELFPGTDENGKKRYSHFTSPAAFGHYRDLFNYRAGDSTLTFTIGKYGNDLKPNDNIAAIEFNPNKVANDEAFWALIQVLSPFVQSAELVRYDLALDVPIHKDKIILLKAAKNYQLFIGNQDGVTEYAGANRNHAGRFKLYDKTKEAGIDEPVTRAELTCAGKWSADEIKANWQKIAVVNEINDSSTSEMSDYIEAMKVLREYAPHEANRLIAMKRTKYKDSRTRAKFDKLLADSWLTPDIQALEAIRAQAMQWCDTLAM